MKLLKLTLICMLIIACQSSKAQSNVADTSLLCRVIKTELALADLKSKVKAHEPEKVSSEKEADKKNNCNCSLSLFERSLLLCPFFTGMLFIIWIICRLRKEKYSLALALSYNPYLSSTSGTSQLKDIDPEKLHLYYQPSSARLMAFLSGFITIIIAFSLAIYSAYTVMCNREVPDFNNLLAIFAALGLGIIPYGISRATAKKEDQAPNPPAPAAPMGPSKP